MDYTDFTVLFLGEMGAGHSSGLRWLQGALQGQEGSRSFPPLLRVPVGTNPLRVGGKTGPSSGKQNPQEH